MELNPSASGCKCKTLFHGTDRGLYLAELLKLGNYIDRHTSNLFAPSRCMVVMGESKFILNNCDQRALTELLENTADLNGTNLAIKLNANREALIRFVVNENIHAPMYPRSILNLAIILRIDSDLIKELLVHGACVFESNFQSPTALHLAVNAGNMPLVVRELLIRGADANAEVTFLHRSHASLTPLHVALIRDNDATVIEDLLKYGANPNRAAVSNGITPLGMAVFKNKDAQVIKALIKAGANVNVMYNTGKTLLDIAAHRCRNLEAIKELFKHRTDHSNSLNCNNLLNCAIENVEFAKILIKYSLITFKGDYYKLFDLNPHKESSNYATLSHYLEDCVREIVQMETVKVAYNLSLLTFVTTKNTNVALYPDNESTKSITIKENLISNYPIYEDMISPKVKYALERGMLLNELKDMLVYNQCCLTKYLDGKVLPLDIMYILCKYFSNEDICNFMYVISPESL